MVAGGASEMKGGWRRQHLLRTQGTGACLRGKEDIEKGERLTAQWGREFQAKARQEDVEMRTHLLGLTLGRKRITGGCSNLCYPCFHFNPSVWVCKFHVGKCYIRPFTTQFAVPSIGPWWGLNK